MTDRGRYLDFDLDGKQDVLRSTLVSGLSSPPLDPPGVIESTVTRLLCSRHEDLGSRVSPDYSVDRDEFLFGKNTVSEAVIRVESSRKGVHVLRDRLLLRKTRSL